MQARGDVVTWTTVGRRPVLTGGSPFPHSSLIPTPFFSLSLSLSLSPPSPAASPAVLIHSPGVSFSVCRMGLCAFNCLKAELHARDGQLRRPLSIGGTASLFPSF